MAFLSLFEVVGPNMTGPSSSHTAGACSIAYIARRMFNKELKEVKFILYGSFAQTYKGHGTDKALLGGALMFAPDSQDIKRSFEIAKERGIAFSFEESNLDPVHPNTVDVCMTSVNNEVMTVKGVSTGGGKIKIVGIDGAEIEFLGQYPTLIMTHKDKKGALAFVCNTLKDANVNIAFLKLSRDAKGEDAHAIIELDDKLNDEVLEELRKNELIKNVMLIQI